MQAFISALSALCVFAFIVLIAGCAGDACLGMPAVLGPIFVVSVFVFIAGLAIWRSDARAGEAGATLKITTCILGLGMFIVACILLLAVSARP